MLTSAKNQVTTAKAANDQGTEACGLFDNHQTDTGENPELYNAFILQTRGIA